MASCSAKEYVQAKKATYHKFYGSMRCWVALKWRKHCNLVIALLLLLIPLLKLACAGLTTPASKKMLLLSLIPQIVELIKLWVMFNDLISGQTEVIFHATIKDILDLICTSGKSIEIHQGVVMHLYCF